MIKEDKFFDYPSVQRIRENVFEDVVAEMDNMLSDYFRHMRKSIDGDTSQAINLHTDQLLSILRAEMERKFIEIEGRILFAERTMRERMEALVSDTAKQVKEMEERVSLAVMMSATDEFGMF
jgi:hypothetical protein